MVDEDGGRAELIAGLTGPGEADRACRLALEAGATVTVWTGPVPVAGLATIYRRRVRHLQDRGVATIGSDTVVMRLESFDGATVRIGSVDSADFTFVVFLDDQVRAVSCLGVGRRLPNPDWYWPGS